VLQQMPGSEAAFFSNFTPLTVGTAPAEERLQYERALLARSEQGPAGARENSPAPSSGSAVTLSTYENNARASQESQDLLAKVMKVVWTILAFVIGGLLALGLGYTIATWQTRVSGGVKIAGCFVIVASVISFVICSGDRGGPPDWWMSVSAPKAAPMRMGADIEGGTILMEEPGWAGMNGWVLDDSKSMKTKEPLKGRDALVSGDRVGQATPPPDSKPAPRIRDYFPETLKWAPELITNEKGVARWPLKMADSITTWRLSTSAVTSDGRLGAGKESIKVFQPFFVELQLPIALVREDEVAVPVIVYNYLDSEQTVTVKLADSSWFDRLDQREKRLTLRANDVAATSFRIRVKKVGLHEMTVFAEGTPAKGGTPTADAIRREIRVVPNGRAVEQAWNGALVQAKEFDITLPDSAVEDSAQLLLKIYPSTFSQALEGLDSIFRMPTGCFEQTSSSTYPNVLALDYLRRTGKGVKDARGNDVEAKARNYVHLGYQRLVSFEVPGGGFDWFGRPPANRTLTAYGLLEFQDMARVHDVDPKLISRTRAWLLSKRGGDGSWEPEGHVPDGLPGQHIGGAKLARLSTTAYIAWAVFQPVRSPGESANDAAPTRNFLVSHPADQIDDPHVLALVANALLGLSGSDARPYLDRLEALKKTSADGRHVFWQQPENARTTFHGRGQSGQVETTALACLAMIQAKRNPVTVKAGLSWLTGERDPHGTWYSTQATVLALKALLAESTSPAALERRVVWAFKDGKQGTIVIDADQAEVMKMEPLTPHLRTGANRLTLTDVSGTAAGYQVTLRYHEPEARRKNEPFLVDVRYEKNKLRVGDLLPVEATISNEQTDSAPMVMVELPVPAGFSLNFDDWTEMVRKEQIAKYQVEAGRVLVYLRALPGKATLKLPYRLRATMAVRIQVPAAKAYEYYNPAQVGFGSTASLTVEDRP
jgi:hypothetical protein